MLTEVAKIVHNLFPIPSIPLPEPPPSSIRDERSGHHASDENTPSPNSSKENIVLETPPAGQSPRLRHLPVSPPPFRPVPPDSSITGPPGTLPPQILSTLSSLQSTLKTSFATAPPHTAQRLAELILRPTRHYRTLLSYLRALDRVLSVSSPANVFPLPPIGSSLATINGRLLNGSSTPDPSDPSSGEDDFIGGAELTPIPWLNVSSMSSYLSGERPYMSDLRTESTSVIDGPNGAGSLETVTVSINGVPSRSRDDLAVRAERMGTTTGPLSSHPTQHENRHPHSHVHPNGTATTTTMEDGNSTTEMEEEPGEIEADEEQHHATARGPEVIGMEDIGPQGPNAPTFAVDAPPHHEVTSPFNMHAAQGEQEQRSTQQQRGIGEEGHGMREETEEKPSSQPSREPLSQEYIERASERKSEEREGEEGKKESEVRNQEESRLADEDAEDEDMPDAAVANANANPDSNPPAEQSFIVRPTSSSTSSSSSSSTSTLT